MWLKGRKHRVQMHPKVSFEGLKKGLQDFITSVVKRLHTEDQKISTWAATITHAMEAKFTHVPCSEKSTFLSKSGQEEFQKLRRAMAICTVDKSAQDFGFWCRKLPKPVDKKPFPAFSRSIEAKLTETKPKQHLRKTSSQKRGAQS